MTSRRVLVELMTSTLPVLDPLIQNSNNIIYRSTVHDNQILYKESIGRVPSTMQYSAWGIKQIPNLFVIDFCEWSLDRKLLVLLLRVFPKVFYCPWDNSISFIRLKYLLLVVFLLSCHCVRLATTRLPICENSDRVTVQCRFNIVLN